VFLFRIADGDFFIGVLNRVTQLSLL
jgi:hypothetical protein